MTSGWTNQRIYYLHTFKLASFFSPTSCLHCSPFLVRTKHIYLLSLSMEQNLTQYLNYLELKVNTKHVWFSSLVNKKRCLYFPCVLSTADCRVSLDKSIQMCGEIVSVFVSATFCTKKGYLNISLQLDMDWLVSNLNVISFRLSLSFRQNLQ